VLTSTAEDSNVKESSKTPLKENISPMRYNEGSCGSKKESTGMIVTKEI